MHDSLASHEHVPASYAFQDVVITLHVMTAVCCPCSCAAQNLSKVWRHTAATCCASLVMVCLDMSQILRVRKV